MLHCKCWFSTAVTSQYLYIHVLPQGEICPSKGYEGSCIYAQEQSTLQFEYSHVHSMTIKEVLYRFLSSLNYCNLMFKLSIVEYNYFSPCSSTEEFTIW